MKKVLIVTEKNTSARKISEILSKGKFKTEKKGSYPIYTWKDNNKTFKCFGVKGHILKADFPESYSSWQKVDLKALVNAEIEKKPIVKSIVSLLRSQAKEADELIIATDFDREGELIGVDGLNLALKANPNLKYFRARFSALTPEEIQKAFSNLESPYFDLAEAGEARQDIDLVWGATLTRYISLASRRFGKRFLSVGRVQSPTLSLIVNREKEIRNFVPTPYYQVLVELEYHGHSFKALHKKERFLKKEEAEAVLNKLGESGVVRLVKKEKKQILPPTPFNTTDFLSAAASIGVNPSRAMQIAENLYTQGFISYPRTDNTVYPGSINLREVTSNLLKYPKVAEYARALLEKEKLIATRGKKQTTDHPPIYPTGIIPESLKPEEEKIYELVVRRFLATLSDPASYESQKAEIDISGEVFFIRGFHLLSPGFLSVYPYKSHKEDEIPPLSEGDNVKVIGKELLEKETQPPARYTQARLIKLMEELGLGTKATRHQIIQNLYERGYITGNPIQPTEVGIAVAETLQSHMERIATPQMTAELEKEMDEIAEGKKEKEEVVTVSRKMLLGVLDELEGKKEKVGERIIRGAISDQIIGMCPECGGNIVIRKSAKTKKRFLGCSRYPECKVTFPLPQKGAVYSEGRECEYCGTPMVRIINKSKRPWIICPNMKCPSKKDLKADAQGE